VKALLSSDSFLVRGDWDSSPGDAFSSSGYGNGVYFIKAKGAAEIYSPHQAAIGNIRVAVTATSASAKTAVFGVSCGSHPINVQSNTVGGGEYQGVVDTNGYWAIRKDYTSADGSGVEATLNEADSDRQPDTPVKPGGPNKVALECLRDPDNAVTVRLFVNDHGVAAVRDAAGLDFGETGILVEAKGGPDVEVDFNDYEVDRL
jgi:hypothetical protein